MTLTRISAVIGAVALGVACSGFVVGCSDSKPRCQTGEASSVAAVRELLSAAAEGDLDRACKVTTELSVDDLRGNLAEIGAFVNEAGGVASLALQENVSLQMGSEHFVEVQIYDSTAVVMFSVIQRGDRYVVGIPDGSPYDGVEPTSNPNPRPIEPEVTPGEI